MDKILQVHPDHWGLVYTVAICISPHYHYYEGFGILVDNQFKRGVRGVDSVYSNKRDRVRALQLMYKIMPLVERKDAAVFGTEKRAKLFGDFWLSFADILSTKDRYDNDNYRTLQFQQRTDLNTLPDYETDEEFFAARRNNFAPVDEKGNPIFYSVPASFDSARSDGERWRYVLA